MIKTFNGDITKIEGVQYICNAANAIGPMGAGVAGAIRKAGGKRIQDEALRVCSKLKPKAGDIYVTDAGHLPYTKIIHLVTMDVPGGFTSLDIVGHCLDKLISKCHFEKIDKVALPALGTGIGGLNKQAVAKLYVDKLALVNDIEFIIVDIDTEFTKFINHELINR
jgi:O-acetyl-ADP-ribose deacetylase (regulator of RNase III)